MYYCDLEKQLAELPTYYDIYTVDKVVLRKKNKYRYNLTQTQKKFSYIENAVVVAF